ncbi:MAG: FtsX-like permease family protein [Labedaea sp.]
MSGWRIVLRLAWREMRRSRGRSALVLALIALPVAASAFIAVGYDSFTLTSAEQADRRMGTAQAVISWEHDEPVAQVPDFLRPFAVDGDTLRPKTSAPTEQQVLSLLPPGSRVLPDRTGTLAMHTATGTGTLHTRELAYTDPLAHGMFHQLAGRAPAAADEVALTPAAATRLDGQIGGTVRLADGTRTLRVVGTVEDPSQISATLMVLAPRAAPAGPDGLTWLAATPAPLTWAGVKELNKQGAVALSRQVLANPPGEDERYRLGVRIGDRGGAAAGMLLLVGGLAMLEIVLLAGPAFAVGARRRQRDLALVAATGATPAQVRRIVLADGVVLGSIAAAGGAALGIAAAAIARPLLEPLLDKRSGALRVYPVAQVILVGLAVLTGVLAALVPAVISARQDVVAALAGRRGITRSRRRWPMLGLVVAAGGAAVSVLGALTLSEGVLLFGLVGLETGLVLCTPALVGLVARLGRWLPVAPRIALRDTSRNRTAAAPAISAVMAAVVGSMAIALMVGADLRRTEDSLSGRPGDVVVYASDLGGHIAGIPPTQLAEIQSALRDTMPVERLAQVSLISCGGTDCLLHPKVPAALDCPYSFDRLDGRTPTADEQRAARHDSRCDRLGYEHTYFAVMGSAFAMTVVIDPESAGVVANIPDGDAALATEALRAGKVVVDDPRYLEDGRLTLSVDVPGTDVRKNRSLTAAGFALPHLAKAPIILMTGPTADTLGLDHRPFLTVATTSRMPTVAEQDRLQAEVGDGLGVDVARGEGAQDQTLLILAIVAGVIALGAAALATGLAATDGRADLATLAAVGASPRLRRMLSLSQSGVIAGLGSLLGVIAGLGAASVVLFALNQHFADIWPAEAAYPITVPWLNLGVALVVVPAVAMLGAGLLTRSRLPVERRRR